MLRQTEAHSEAYKKIVPRQGVAEGSKQEKYSSLWCPLFSLPFPAPSGETPSPKLTLTTKRDHCMKKQALLEAPTHYGFPYCWDEHRVSDLQCFTILLSVRPSPQRSCKDEVEEYKSTPGTQWDSLTCTGGHSAEEETQAFTPKWLNKPKPAITKHSHYCCLFLKSYEYRIWTKL